MIVDSSALIAFSSREPGWESISKALLTGEAASISSVTWLETSIVLSGDRYRFTPEQLGTLFRLTRMAMIDFTSQHTYAAIDAYRRYGRGNHPARLNFGDCSSYATAVLAGEPLLYVGDDFAQTDIESALPSKTK